MKTKRRGSPRGKLFTVQGHDSDVVELWRDTSKPILYPDLQVSSSSGVENTHMFSTPTNSQVRDNQVRKHWVRAGLHLENII